MEAVSPFALSSIRTMTVGSGLSPDLLTPLETEGALAGLQITAYRRWGISPRPENRLSMPACAQS